MDMEISAEAPERLRLSRSVAVLTGAGISAESGVPTFRGPDGLWKKHRPEQLATPQAFARDPDLVWEWYHWRRALVRSVRPNPGHDAIAWLERNVEHFTLITQNVDGLHREAGNERILELHGTIHRARCQDCPAVVDLAGEDGVIICPACGGLMRPDVVWFGESLDRKTLESAYVASAGADFLMVVGTSSVVQPAASLAYAALGNGGYVLEVNLDPTPLTGTASGTILGKGGEVLPELVRLAFGKP
ncbi:MAG: NAD-dependent deacylase [bacterium]|nr:NAD-dependent deacylase [bacterium]